MKSQHAILLTVFTFLIFQIGCTSRWKEIYPGVQFTTTDLPIQELAFDPTGKYLAVNFTVPAFLGQPTEKLSVWDLEANHFVDIIPSDSSNIGSLTWHPEKNAVVFFSSEAFDGIGMIDLDSPEKTTISTSGSYLSWTPNVNEVVIEAYKQLLLLDLSTGNEELLWDIGELISGNFYFSGVEVSPDGKQMIVAIQKNQGSLTDNHLILNDLTSHSHSILLEYQYPIYALDWFPSGELIMFLINTEGIEAVFALEVDTGCITRPLPLEGARDLAWSADGGTLAVATSSGDGHRVYFIDASSKFFVDWIGELDCRK